MERSAGYRLAGTLQAVGWEGSTCAVGQSGHSGVRRNTAERTMTVFTQQRRDLENELY